MNKYVGTVERDYARSGAAAMKTGYRVNDRKRASARLGVARAIQLCVVSLIADANEMMLSETAATLFSVLDAASRDAAKLAEE
jgi:hypothetical protein